MQAGGFLIVWADAALRECTLFAAVGFLLGGVDDLLVDLIWIAGAIRRRWAAPPASDEGAERKGPVAIFLPAWDESAVIGAMLRNAVKQLGRQDYYLYVGAYPNDRATIDAVAQVAGGRARIRLVINARPGPTTKADCLNRLWRALLRHEAAGGRKACAVMLHDAEDLVHAEEIRVVKRHLRRHAAVQLPVIPLRKPDRPGVQAHYCDEFAEAHGKQLPVRQAIGAGLPLAGVGCAIRRDMIERIAEARGGEPFDQLSLTEDYELGLTIASLGGSTSFASEAATASKGLVAVRAYFPESFQAAVRQKARWMTGIALAGWDRTGWGRLRAVGDHWMRMRDRRAILSVLVLAVGYLALLLWPCTVLMHVLAGTAAPALHPGVRALLLANLALLGWRVLVRSYFVARAYGWREARWALPRMILANIIALAAARRAAWLYLKLLAGGPPVWEKTAHDFPEDLVAEARAA
ncbi:glycosyl transferase family protein [Sphingomonas sp.]|uniref:glycosyl transferase family protein n=1 Tax=Sphingomonas sp. TaxID=28214 RepID=UPI001B17C642|nr:glycosyl transferase family protein [Sphingomonas sp.]MBO9712372.1 glycosyl transferase family protein [Sphingomonas sp.]